MNVILYPRRQYVPGKSVLTVHSYLQLLHVPRNMLEEGLLCDFSSKAGLGVPSVYFLAFSEDGYNICPSPVMKYHLISMSFLRK